MGTMTVCGNATAGAPPDRIEVFAELSKRSKDYAEAVKQSEQALEKLRAAAETCGFSKEELKTLSFNVTSEYESRHDGKGGYAREFAGFLVSHRLCVRFAFDRERLDRLIDGLSKSGTDAEFSLSFGVRDAEALSKRAIEAAVEDAKTKAETLARAAGVTIEGIESIEYSGGGVAKNVGRPRMMAAMNDSTAMDFTPEDTKASERVSIVFKVV